MRQALIRVAVGVLVVAALFFWLDHKSREADKRRRHLVDSVHEILRRHGVGEQRRDDIINEMAHEGVFGTDGSGEDDSSPSGWPFSD